MKALSYRTRLLVPALVAGTVLACAESPSAPGNRAPTVTISSPGAIATFAGGDSIDVMILATDREQGVLPGASVSWWVDLHHTIHTHPFRPPSSGTVGRFGVGRAGFDDSDVFLRVYARAVDAQGLADTAFVDVHPRVTTFTVTSAPAGLTVTVDGQPRQTPYVKTEIVGIERVLGAASEQVVGSVLYGFNAWSDAGAATHTVTIPSSPHTVTAIYDSLASTNAAPSVTLTSPAEGAVVNVGASVTLSATTSDPDGSVASVTFLVNGVAVATDGAPPFNAVWIPTAPGEGLLVARATDDGGAVGSSAPRVVTVQPSGAPTVTLDAPVHGTLDLTGAVLIEATALDDVSVTFVEFDVDGALIGIDSTAPYSATVPTTGAYASGAHIVRVRARDGDGNFSAWARATVTFGGAVALPDGFTLTTIASGLGGTPTAIAVAPDGRLFVTEQTGAVRVVKNGALLGQPLLTLPVVVDGERGLLGLAFDPAFTTNGWVYVYHTTSSGGTHNRISRFTVVGDVASGASEVVLLDLPPLGVVAKHSGGAMRFGPDGLLYVAVGDDGEPTNAPSMTTPFGKILRVARDGSIPTDNPFFGTTSGVNRAIWARGLRNPFTFDIHPTSGRMHINDVGQGTWEEINVGRPGADFGWPITEGPTMAAGYDSPLLAYRHVGSPTLFDGFAVVGAAFYVPTTVNFGAEYVGDYFFGDYVNQWIYRLDAQANWAPYAFADLDGPITGLAVGQDGALYVLVGTRIDRIAR